MTDPRIHELLAEPLDDATAHGLTPEAELVLRHVAVAEGVLASIAPAYVQLRAGVVAAGASDAVATALAVELAGAIAAVQRSVRAQPEALAAASAAGLEVVAVFDVMDALLHSLLLLADPPDLPLALTPPQLTELLRGVELDLGD